MTDQANRDDLAARFDALITTGTAAAVASVVEHTIDAEYGRQDPDGLAGARVLAIAGIKMDTYRTWVTANGSDSGLPSYAALALRTLVRRGLDARRCPCTTGGTDHGHSSGVQCSGHTEADVPPLDGVKLCGTCHGAVYRATV